METYHVLFLQALGASLKNKKVAWTQEIPLEQWERLFGLADTHNVLPMIYEAVYSCESAKSLPVQLLGAVARKSMRMISMQAVQTAQFKRLYGSLREADAAPLVVKGIVCRNLYPNPDYRYSGDEDLLISEEKFHRCHEAMLNFGMQLTDPEKDIETAHELGYVKAGSPIYIELHKALFPPESDAYGDFNKLFAHVWEHTVETEAEGERFMTLGYTDHLFYLICHALKHFLHSGFGVRQVCDIVLFAEYYGKDIDWQDVYNRCKAVNGEVFTAALFRIGERYFGFDPDAAHLSEEWRRIETDEEMLLEDLLEAGIYGDSDLSRKHSSNMTLGAVAADKKGKKAKGGVMKSVFPSAKALSGRYPYLEKKPYLLPVAWTDRLLKYRKETASTANSDVSESLKIGGRRVELLKEYKIVK